MCVCMCNKALFVVTHVESKLKKLLIVELSSVTPRYVCVNNLILPF